MSIAKSCLVVCSALLALSTQAAVRKFPHGCRPVGSKFSGNLLVLDNMAEEHPQTLYLVHNINNGAVTLKRRPVNSQDLGPLYKNTIRYDQWGGFATDKQLQYFACYSGEGEYMHAIDCANAIEVCQYTRAKFGEGNMGTYWSVKSMSLYGAKREAIQQGLLLRW